MADPEISRFPCKELPYMPGSATTPGQTDARDCAPARVAFRSVDSVGAREIILSRLNGWPACSPTDASPAPLRMPARLGADVARYAFTAMDLHHLLLAGLPAHQL